MTILSRQRNHNYKQKIKELEPSENHYRNLVENAPVGVYQTDIEGKILFVNMALAQILEFKSPAEMISTSVQERYKNLDDRNLLIKALKKKGQVNSFETELITKKGNNRDVILNAKLDGDILSGMILDNTERKNNELQIKNKISQLSALRNIDMAITSSLDLGVTLNVFLENVLKQLKVDAADVLLMDAHTRMLKYSYSLGFNTSALQYTNLHLGEGYAGLAAKERTIVNIPDLSIDIAGLKSSPLLAEEGFIRYIAVPLIAKDHVLGVLEIFNRSPKEISNPDEWF